jgi:glutamine amidotransferase
MIAVVDYGVGNVRAFLNAFRLLNIDARATRSSAELEAAEKIILPGVGAFDHAVERLEASGMRQMLDHLVLERRVPVLGVCVGMQMLGLSSEEGERPGLGWIEGRVRSLRTLTSSAAPLHLPHMGWNDVRPRPTSSLFAGLEGGAPFYFLHSFYFECQRAPEVAAVSDYGSEFACAVQVGNICGVQFHPEKSHHAGTQLLQNFSQR